MKQRRCPTVRRSHLEIFCKNGILKNFAKYTGKKPVSESLF